MAQEQTKSPEVWMRGPVEGVPALLQPVAHTLLQAAEEIEALMAGYPDAKLWVRPAGMASPAFHLQHIPGVLDRLFTYAKGQQLSQGQLKYLSEEGLQMDNTSTADLVQLTISEIRKAVDALKTVDPATLTEPRLVGRKKLPSTVIGLLFHSAEHTMRHTGQLLVSATVGRLGDWEEGDEKLKV